MGSPHPTRAAVLDTALELLAADGPAGVTIASITRASGVSNGSIYHHFGSRDGVLRALLVDCFADLVTTLTAALDDRPAQDCIRDLVARHLAWVQQHPGKAAAIYRVPLHAGVLSDDPDDPDTRAVLARKASAAAALLPWIRARQDAGELRAIPDWALDPIALAPVHEAARRGLSGPDVEREVADMVWAGLAGPAETSRRPRPPCRLS